MLPIFKLQFPSVVSFYIIVYQLCAVIQGKIQRWIISSACPQSALLCRGEAQIIKGSEWPGKEVQQ